MLSQDKNNFCELAASVLWISLTADQATETKVDQFLVSTVRDSAESSCYDLAAGVCAPT